MTTTEPLIPHDAAATIAAGGIVAKGVKLPADERPSMVSARAYPHPAIAGKVIIRIEPDAVADGVDAEMEAFGFGEPEVTKDLGVVRHRTLGFPAWALVNDPKKAKIALGVTEDLRKAKKMVVSKPGHAKEAFEKIAKVLGRGAPHFLPSFWEEAGRIVADQASATMAAQMFEKARAAERAYKLKVDADDRDAVFVEFALMGALSAKTLSEYAKDLVKSEGGKEAYRRFKSIVTKRALGGMPPWSGMGKDLKRLAEGADLDVEAEQDAVCAELIDAPGVGRAPNEFWETYRESLLRLGSARAEVRNRLRNLWPEPRGGDRDNRPAVREAWLELLQATGSFDDIPDDGLAAWVSRLFKFAGNTERTRGLLEKLAPRLAAQKEPIQILCPRGRWWGTDLDLDLCEKALSLGVPLADPESSDDFMPDQMTCDPVLTAAEPRYGKKLREAVENMMGEAEHEKRMHGKQGFLAARRAWIEERMSEVEKSALPGVSSALERIESKTSAETFLTFPDLLERFKSIELSAAVARTLQGGIVDEWHWPEYEKAFADLGGKELTLGGSFPYLTLWNAAKVVALGPKGVVAEHDFVYKPADHKIETVFYFDKQFLVVLDPEKGWQNVAYWSSAPKDVFDWNVYLRNYGGDVATETRVPTGGVTLGYKAFSAGEKEIEGGSRFYLSDGKTFWISEWDDGEERLYEFDCAKGQKVGQSIPPFLDGWTKDGWKRDTSSCVLVPAPEGLTSSPLGIKDGLLGMRVRQEIDEENDDGGYECERIDGVTWRGKSCPFALMTFPGDDKPRAITTMSADNKKFVGGDGFGVYLWSDDGEQLAGVGEHDWASRGWGAVHTPPGAMWDYLSPRDVAGSKALRATTAAASKLLIDAAKAELTDGKMNAELPATEAAVKAALGITNPALQRGAAGIAARAAELQAQIANMAADRAKENANPGGQALAEDAKAIRKLAAAFETGRATKIADFSIDLERWLIGGRSHAVQAMGSLEEDDELSKCKDVMKAIAGTMFADDLSKMRLLTIEAPDDYEDPEDWNTLVITKHEESWFAIHPSGDWALELSTDGKFRPPPIWNVTAEKKLTKGVGSAWAEAFGALEGRIPWDPAGAEKLAQLADMSVQEATLLYCGLHNRTSWGRDFLGKPKREKIGLKMGEADAARTMFKEMDQEEVDALFGQAAPEDPKLLLAPLAPGGWVDALGAAWKAKYGKRVKIAQDLIAQAKKDLNFDDDHTKVLGAFAGNVDAKFLTIDESPLHELGGWGAENFYPAIAKDLVTVMAWLYFARPVGDPIRSGIPAVFEKVKKLIEDSKLIWKLDDKWIDDDDEKDKTKAQELVALVGGKEITLPKDGDDECIAARDDGTLIVGYYKNQVQAGFRPAKLDASGKKKVETYINALRTGDDEGGDDIMAIKVAQLLASDGLQGIADAVREPEVPEGKYEANPLLSAKKVVQKVVKEHGISEDAAVVYLQVLACAEPTTKNIQLWNEWKPKQVAAAGAELVKKKLLTGGKRERTGRDFFLKGGYDKGDKKNLPMEEWKLPFYSSIDRRLPTEPMSALFARAWKRIEDGDVPGG
jgi:hypothetical protein